jgi:hypothetical protein
MPEIYGKRSPAVSEDCVSGCSAAIAIAVSAATMPLQPFDKIFAARAIEFTPLTP